MAARAHPPVEKKRPVLIILHQEHSTPGAIGQWFVNNGYPLDIKRPRFGCVLPDTMEQHTGAVIFGGPMSANDDEDFVRREIGLISLALKQEQPFLGVCLGAQMLARLLGAKVELHPKGLVEIGYHPVQATPEGQRICDWPDHFYQFHKEGFELPAGAKLLATGGAFPNQAFSYGPAAVGVQFHSEITYAMVSRWSGRNLHRLDVPGGQSWSDQRAGHIEHGPKVRRWLDQFLGRWAKAQLPVASIWRGVDVPAAAPPGLLHSY